MKLKLTKPETARPAGDGHRWPGYLLGGRVRTSTVVLIIAFAGVWWVYDTYREDVTPPAAPQVVPPGFIPDPAYTWVPRTRLQQPPATVTETVTPTPTTTETPSPTSEPPIRTPVPGFPFCPPFCPPDEPEQSPAPPESPPPPAPEPPPAPPGSPAPSTPVPSAAPAPPPPARPAVP